MQHPLIACFSHRLVVAPLLGTLLGLAGGAAPALAQPVYQEVDGVLAIEAENATDLPTQHWRVESSVPGASGGSYLRALTDSFPTPGIGIIGYDFRTSRESRFQFAFNSRIGQGNSSTDHNDAWVRVVDSDGFGVAPVFNRNDTRAGQWHKVYMNQFGRWDHQASNRDNDGRSLSWILSDETEYTLQISSRSQGHLIDRLFLWDTALPTNFANREHGWSPNNGAFAARANSPLAVPEPGAGTLLVASALGVACRRRRR